jgi:hypothetical protein
MIRVTCPNCSKVHRLDNLMVARPFVCPDCGRKFRVGKPANKSKEAENAITTTAADGPEDWQTPLVGMPELPNLKLPRNIVREDVSRQERTPQASPDRGSASSRPAWSWLAATVAVLALCSWCLTLVAATRLAHAQNCVPFGFAVFLTILAVTFQFGRSWQAKLFGSVTAIAVAWTAALASISFFEKHSDQEMKRPGLPYLSIHVHFGDKSFQEAQTIWIQTTYVDYGGRESPPSPMASIEVRPGDELEVRGTRTTYGSRWYVYVATGKQRPARTSMYRQGSALEDWQTWTLNREPSTFGANPPG